MSGYASLPDKQQQALARAVRLEWWTLAWMGSVIILLAFVLGSSQAMRTAWIEDILSLLPPAAFIIAEKVGGRRASRRFPYGLQRFNSIAFLASAVALTGLGGMLCIESAWTLVTMEHPSIGSVFLFGREIWLGWLMIGALVYSVLPPVILGRMKLPLADALQDKTLRTDADMNKADWMTGLAAAAGVLGVGLGFWWADATAALFISVDILRDGLRGLRTSVVELADGAPRKMESRELDPLVELMERELDHRGLKLQPHLRITGRFVTGELVGPDADKVTPDLLRALEAIDWRVSDLAARPLKDDEYPAFSDQPGAPRDPLLRL
jgi:divalent metal cation (Fe/Co/Zn/Cd) transporter